MSNFKIKRGYGIIAPRYNENNELEILLIRRRYTVQMCDFLFGGNEKITQTYLEKLSKNLTNSERFTILYKSFENIWDEIFDKNEILKSKRLRKRKLWRKKFIKRRLNKIRSSLCYKNIIKKYYNNYFEQEWEFPKGKRKTNKEKYVNCALREFSEETCINKKNVNLYDPNSISIIEDYIGTNNINYVNTYYLGETDKEPIFNPLNKGQRF